MTAAESGGQPESGVDPDRDKILDTALSLLKADHQGDIDQNIEFQRAMIETTKGSIDRVRSGAEAVRTASAAIGTLYTGILAVAFSVSSHPLPLRGALPALFLALSVALATGYLAYVTRGPEGVDLATVQSPDSGWTRFRRWLGRVRGVYRGSEVGIRAKPQPGLPGQLTRVIFLVEWVRRQSIRRAAALQSSVIALGLGAFLLPVAFVDVPNLEGGSPTVSTVEPRWPRPDPRITDPGLAKALYEKRVAEVAEQRSKALQANPADDKAFSAAIAGGGLMLVLLPFGWALTRPLRQKLIISPTAAAPSPAPAAPPGPPQPPAPPQPGETPPEATPPTGLNPL